MKGRPKNGRLLAVPALLIGLTAMVAAAENDGCSNATLKGDVLIRGHRGTGARSRLSDLWPSRAKSLWTEKELRQVGNGRIVGDIPTDMPLT